MTIIRNLNKSLRTYNQQRIRFVRKSDPEKQKTVNMTTAQPPQNDVKLEHQMMSQYG
jgi:hypothetical protein